MAAAAMVFSADAAFAGGGGGSSKSSTELVRIKNIGAAPVLVNAKNGAVSAAGGKTVSSTGVAQFRQPHAARSIIVTVALSGGGGDAFSAAALVGPSTAPLGSNGVAQFKIKRGAANAYAQNQSASATSTLPFSFSDRVTVYLEAPADATTATMTFAPPGKLF